MKHRHKGKGKINSKQNIHPPDFSPQAGGIRPSPNGLDYADGVQAQGRKTEDAGFYKRGAIGVTVKGNDYSISQSKDNIGKSVPSNGVPRVKGKIKDYRLTLSKDYNGKGVPSKGAPGVRGKGNDYSLKEIKDYNGKSVPSNRAPRVKGKIKDYHLTLSKDYTGKSVPSNNGSDYSQVGLSSGADYSNQAAVPGADYNNEAAPLGADYNQQGGKNMGKSNTNVIDYQGQKAAGNGTDVGSNASESQNGTDYQSSQAAAKTGTDYSGQDYQSQKSALNGTDYSSHNGTQSGTDYSSQNGVQNGTDYSIQNGTQIGTVYSSQNGTQNGTDKNNQNGTQSGTDYSSQDYSLGKQSGKEAKQVPSDGKSVLQGKTIETSGGKVGKRKHKVVLHYQFLILNETAKGDRVIVNHSALVDYNKQSAAVGADYSENYTSSEAKPDAAGLKNISTTGL